MKSIKRSLMLSVLVTISVALLLVTGCVSRSITAQGWSGVAAGDDRMFYIATIAGGSSGFLGCGASPSQSELIVLNAADGGVLNTLNLGDSTVSYGTPAVSGSYAYLTGYNGKVFKVNVISGGTPTGVFLNPEHPKSIVGGAAVAENRVFAGSVDGKLYALDAGSLDKLWEFATGDQIWSTPAVSGDIVYIGSFDKSVYAVDAATGAKKWSYATAGAVVATPVISGNRVYVASLDRHVYALDAASGSLVWQFPAVGAAISPKNWFWAAPVIVGSELYAADTDGMIYILSVQDGSLIGSPLSAGDSIVSSPVASDNNVVFLTEQGNILVIDATTGQFDGSPYQLRAYPPTTSNSTIVARGALTADNHLVYVHTSNPERVFQFNPATREVTEIGTRQSTVTAPPETTAGTTITATVTSTVTVTATSTG